MSSESEINEEDIGKYEEIQRKRTLKRQLKKEIEKETEGMPKEKIEKIKEMRRRDGYKIVKKEYERRMTRCEVCGKEIRNSSYAKHITSKRHIENTKK